MLIMLVCRCDEDQSVIFLQPVQVSAVQSGIVSNVWCTRVQVGMCLAYLTIFLVGVVGNLLVLIGPYTNIKKLNGVFLIL